MLSALDTNAQCSGSKPTARGYYSSPAFDGRRYIYWAGTTAGRPLARLDVARSFVHANSWEARSLLPTQGAEYEQVLSGSVTHGE